MNVGITLVPYDSGHRSVRMGGGPEHLLDNGLDDALEDCGCRAHISWVEPEDGLRAEVSTAFEISRLISESVRVDTQADNFPLVLSGNCNSSLGTIAGADPSNLGIVWFDGHADFNTPETTTTGFIDGMGLATAVGHCWSAMAENVPGFVPVPEPNVVLVGAREIEPAEQRRLLASKISVVDADSIREKDLETLEAVLDALKGRVKRVYVHLDLDVLAPDRIAPANEFALPRGLTTEEVEKMIQAIHTRFAVAAAGIASYDPSYDPDDQVLRAAFTLAQTLTRPPKRA